MLALVRSQVPYELHTISHKISQISAGKLIKKGKVRKIVGLDPASPLFRYRDLTGRLAEKDAKYVEILHSCAGLLGFSVPLGTASFYPNGGRSQPGCGWDLFGGCAHGRAYEFFAESLYNENGFYAWHCDSFKALSKGKCQVVNGIVKLGGEPGNVES